jgi:ribulose-5-phosphate 4-epimerase/fuculose-1-phosphate aldolase
MKMRTLLTILFIGAPAVASQNFQSERALIDDLVLANRALASQELGVLDAFGHVSVRSRTNANRFYISRYVAPGIVTAADIIENDLDSKAVTGERNDQYQERFLHGEIYKARPDVMAIVHSHTPELVAFGVSSVRLRSGDQEVPVYDIRKFNNGRSGILDTPALARSMAQTLGKNNAVLLLGHGAVVVSSSVYNIVGSANSLRSAARLQQQLISMGGTWDSNPRRVAPNAPPASGQRATAAPVVPSGTGGGAGGDRAWEYWKWLFTPLITGPNSIPRADRGSTAASQEQETINNVVLANRMLASRELAILDTAGHVSVRNPRNPNHYYISRYVSPGRVTAADISREGYQKVTDIMNGDEVLRMRGGGATGARQGAAPPPGGRGGRGGGGVQFGSAEYYIAILGTPSVINPWMIQFGGHHLAINITIASRDNVMTPSLPATQPARYTLDGKTVRPLGNENDKSFALINALDAAQRKQAVLNYQVRDLVLGPGQDGKVIQPEGIAASAMTPAQQAMLLDLAREWVGILNDEAAAARMSEIKSNLARTYFAWSGPATDGSAAYFRIQGPTVLIEYAPQQGDVDHIHTIYRDPTNDYGAGLLKP